MAGAIAALAKTTLARLSAHRPASARILLIEAGSNFLGAFPEKLGTYARRALTRLGIKIMLNAKVRKNR